LALCVAWEDRAHSCCTSMYGYIPLLHESLSDLFKTIDFWTTLVYGIVLWGIR